MAAAAAAAWGSYRSKAQQAVSYMYRDSWAADAAPKDGAFKTEEELRHRFQGLWHTNASTRQSTGDVLREDMASLGSFLARRVQHLRQEASNIKTFREALALAASPFPIFNTLGSYRSEYLLPDTAAGLVEGILTVPTGLAYALLAYMPPQYGLFTCVAPPLIYLVLGSCRQLSLGASAIEALFLGESVRSALGDDIVNSTDPADVSITVQYTLAMSCLVGFWQLLFWMLRLSFVSVLLSDPVLSGFCTGGAFVIGTSQLSSLLGVSLGNSNFLPALWVKALQEVSTWNWCSIGMGLSGVAFLYVCKAFNRRYLPKTPLPWQILLVIASIVVTSQMRLDETEGLKVVGDIPAGLPPFVVPSLPSVPGRNSSDVLVESILNSLLISLFVFAVFLSLTTSFADRNGYHLSSSRELLALGVSTAVSPLFSSFVCGASFSRTAVVQTLGARTALHGAAAVLVTILALTLITAQLYYLPKCILAAIILSALAPLVEFRQGAEYYRVSKPDFLAWVVTVALCVCAGAMYGIYGGVGLSLLLLVWRSATAKVTVLGRLPGTSIYRPLGDFPEGRESCGVKILRFHGALNFANSATLSARVREAASADGVVTIVLDAGAITAIDISALRALLQLIETLEERGVKLLMCHWGAPQRMLLERTGFYDRVHRDALFLCIHDAVLFARARARAAAAAAPLPPTLPAPVASVRRGNTAAAAAGGNSGAANIAAVSMAASNLVAMATVTDAQGCAWCTAERCGDMAAGHSSGECSGDSDGDIEVAFSPRPPPALPPFAASVRTFEVSSGGHSQGGVTGAGAGARLQEI